MSTWIQRILSVRHRGLVEDLEALTALDAPCHPSASAFRFVYDVAAPPDLGDASAVAQELDLAVQAMSDHEPLLIHDESVSGSGGGAPDPSTSPAATAARELADQAARALVNGWTQEATDLFVAAAGHTPTDPHLWFGAGLSATRHDRPRAAGYLTRASRYYRRTDPPAAAYCLILAACLHDSVDNRPLARQILNDGLTALDRPCPAISLHLARLGPDRQFHMEQALTVDPMLEVDIAAMNLGPEPDLIRRRSLHLRRELGQIEYVTAELRRVDGGPTWPDPPRAPVPGVDRDRFPVAALELALAAKLATCRQALDRARDEVDRCEQRRRLRESEWVRSEELARADLDNRSALLVLAVCGASAVSGVFVTALARLATVRAPVVGAPIAVVSWIIVLALLVGASWLIIATLWSHRRHPLARRARQQIPKLQFEAAQLREDEFAVRQRFNRARREAERRIDLIIERRKALLPGRPDVTAHWRGVTSTRTETADHA